MILKSCIDTWKLSFIYSWYHRKCTSFATLSITIKLRGRELFLKLLRKMAQIIKESLYLVYLSASGKPSFKGNTCTVFITMMYNYSNTFTLYFQNDAKTYQKRKLCWIYYFLATTHYLVGYWQARACSADDQFLYRGMLLTNRLMLQMFQQSKISISPYGRYNDLVRQYHL